MPWSWRTLMATVICLEYSLMTCSWSPSLDTSSSVPSSQYSMKMYISSWGGNRTGLTLCISFREYTEPQDPLGGICVPHGGVWTPPWVLREWEAQLCLTLLQWAACLLAGIVHPKTICHATLDRMWQPCPRVLPSTETSLSTTNPLVKTDNDQPPVVLTPHQHAASCPPSLSVLTLHTQIILGLRFFLSHAGLLTTEGRVGV